MKYICPDYTIREKDNRAVWSKKRDALKDKEIKQAEVKSEKIVLTRIKKWLQL